MTMKIVDHTTPSTCEFGDLLALAVFKTHYGDLYIKTLHSLFLQPDEDAGEVNAISLATGEAEYFSVGEVVYKVEASLTVTLPPSSSR